MPAPPLPGWTEWLVRFLDDGVAIPGTRIRFGADAVLGVILPGLGDGIGALGALSLFAVALRQGVPAAVMMRMAANVGVDALAGAVPLLGDLFDLSFKANRRNLALIEAHSQGHPAEISAKERALFVLAIGIAAVAVTLPFALITLCLMWMFPGHRL
jgi:hypothetical protein